MELSDFPRLILAAAPHQECQIRLSGAVIAHMAYRLEDGPTLYRCAGAEQLRGGVLMADDLRLNRIDDGGFFSQQAVRECRARGAMGFVANWCRPPSREMAAVTAALDKALGQAGLTLWVPEAYGHHAPAAQVMISSALSGGTLKVRLEEAMERFGGRVTLCVEKMAEDFCLPSPSGRGTPLTNEGLRELMGRVHPSVYYSSELCAHYFTYGQNGRVHFVLFDDAGSIRRKLILAKRLGIPWALAAWEEFHC